ncbi:phosphatase PAP2 family protein [Natrialbaceae archaeon A-gly3]
MLLRVLAQVVAVIAFMLIVGLVVVVGRDRLRETRRECLSRLRAVAPIALVLATTLALNGVVRGVSYDLSWTVGWEATWTIYELEGQFIVWIQSLATPPVTAYFSFMYIYGYVFLLVFPIVAYFALADTRPLRLLFASYTFNYVLGLVCYTLVIAYGPRNVMPEFVSPLLYESYPHYQHLTRQVNRNVNVFPSLHTSLAATAAILAYRTRDTYPRWTPVATVLAVSIAVSTMYLGIHWAVDVVAGVALASASVVLADRLVGRVSVSSVE